MNSSSENNKTIPSGEQSSALVNKSKSDVPNNNTGVKADKKNICKNINDMDAGEGSYLLTNISSQTCYYYRNKNSPI